MVQVIPRIQNVYLSPISLHTLSLLRYRVQHTYNLIHESSDAQLKILNP